MKDKEKNKLYRRGFISPRKEEEASYNSRSFSLIPLPREEEPSKQHREPRRRIKKVVDQEHYQKKSLKLDPLLVPEETKIFKDSSLKKLIYRGGGIVKTKSDVLNILNKQIIKNIKNVLEKLNNEFPTKKVISFDDVNCVLNLNFKKSDIPSTICPPYVTSSFDGTDTSFGATNGVDSGKVISGRADGIDSKETLDYSITEKHHTNERKIKFFKENKNSFVFPRSVFKRLVNNISNSFYKYSQEAIGLFQLFIETSITNLVEKSLILSSHRMSKYIEVKDIELAIELLTKKSTLGS